jgi:hypothetical protein
VQVRALISSDANLLARDAQGHTSLHLAASKGHVGLVKLLGDAGGVQLLFRTSYDGRTADEIAALHCHKDTEHVLRELQHGVVSKLLLQEQQERECKEGIAAEYKARSGAKGQLLSVEEYTEIAYNIELCTLAARLQGPDDAQRERFAKELKCGEYRHAANGFSALLNVSENEVSRRVVAGVGAIQEEVKALGDENVSQQLHYILRQRAREKTFSNGVRDRGHAGMRLRDFLQHAYCKTAKLEEAEVVALRLYTTSAFRQINDPLRDEKRIKSGHPHPLPVTVMLIARGIKKLRAIDAQKDEGTETVVLWRGMKNVMATENFIKKGGTEVGCCCCHTSK